MCGIGQLETTREEGQRVLFISAFVAVERGGDGDRTTPLPAPSSRPLPPSGSRRPARQRFARPFALHAPCEGPVLTFQTGLRARCGIRTPLPFSEGCWPADASRTTPAAAGSCRRRATAPPASRGAELAARSPPPSRRSRPKGQLSRLSRFQGAGRCQPFQSAHPHRRTTRARAMQQGPGAAGRGGAEARAPPAQPGG